MPEDPIGEMDCPACGEPCTQIVVCPGCGMDYGVECCAPAGVGCLCLECEEKDAEE